MFNFFKKQKCKECGVGIGLFKTFYYKKKRLCFNCFRNNYNKEHKYKIANTHCIICNKRLGIFNKAQLENGDWICLDCAESKIYSDKYINLLFEDEYLKPFHIEINKENEIDKMSKWKDNLKSKNITRNISLKKGIDFIKNVSFLLKQANPDYQFIRTQFIKCIESIRQFNALNDFEYCKLLQFATNIYTRFVIETDPLYREYLKEILPIIEANQGILQTDIYNKINLNKENISYAFYFAEVEGLIKREKKGRSYQLYLNKNIS